MGSKQIAFEVDVFPYYNNGEPCFKGKLDGDEHSALPSVWFRKFKGKHI